MKDELMGKGRSGRVYQTVNCCSGEDGKAGEITFVEAVNKELGQNRAGMYVIENKR